MAYDFEDLLTERILFEDIRRWLISDSNKDHNAKAIFITSFINYVKEKSSWVISKEGKSSESPQKRSDKQKDEINDQSSRNVPTDSRNQTSVEMKQKDETKHGRKNSPRKFNENKGKNLRDCNGRFSYDHRKNWNDEHNSIKSHSSAKKSLNFYSSKDVKGNGPYHENAQVFKSDINSLEAFPPLNTKVYESKSFDPKVRRRITPTPVQAFQNSSTNFGASRFNITPEKVANDVFNKTPFFEMPTSDLQSERELLKKTRNELINSAVVTNSLNDLKTENVSPAKKVLSYIDPDPEKISHKDQLVKFSSVYSTLITEALVPNITSELYFIFELLTSKVSNDDKPADGNSIFCSIHNCMFFGISVLSELQNVLQFLDHVTLISLSEIPFLSKFSMKLVDFLQTYCAEKPEIVTNSQTLNRVPFLLEEDTRENFIDVPSFTSFRKQRDLFYELLRDWQQQPINNLDTRFHDSFTRKAKNLINLEPNAGNIHHLAKLFQNQLIASCLGLEVNEVYDEFLSNLQQTFPGKLQKLYQRFMMPFCIGEPNPPPTFYGIQAFFSELIQAISSASFNQQLQDIFVAKILDLNSADIFSETELNSLVTVKEQYISLLHTLRLLGKFLGYVCFLPYKVSDSLPANFLNNQLKYRKQSKPPIDITTLLKASMENNRVIITVPWIVEYLSMIDPVGRNLPYVEETLSILLSIYRGKYMFPNSLNIWFLRIMIGWLFDVFRCPQKYYSLPETVETGINSGGIDTLAVIDKQLIHSCCPYLTEFKVLICSFLKGIKNKKREVRKITPLSTAKPSASVSQTKHQIEKQLEENFFFLHPPSMKKTVEFIAERIASKTISKIRSEATDFKFQTIDNITQDETYKTLLSTQNSAKLQSFVDSYILKQYEEFQTKIGTIIHVDSLKNIEHIMPDFFSHDLKPQILKVCCKISFRFAVDKIVEWCDANLIFADISKDIKNKLNHLGKEEDEISAPINISLFNSMITLRRLIIKIHSAPSLSSTEIINVLSELSNIFNNRIGNLTKKTIAFLTVDLYIALILHYPEKCCDECTKGFIHLWSLCPKKYNLENYFLGIQNVKFLIAAKKFQSSSQSFVLMLLLLLNNDSFDSKKLNSSLNKLKSIRWENPRAIDILYLVSQSISKSTANETSK